MNESGRSVKAAAGVLQARAGRDPRRPRRRAISRPGRLQARMGGGLAGHNGLRSIVQHLGTPEFLRLRVGVGRPGRGDRRPLADYVLSDFEPHRRRRRARLAGRRRRRGARRRGARGGPAHDQPRRELGSRRTNPPGGKRPPAPVCFTEWARRLPARPCAAGRPAGNPRHGCPDPDSSSLVFVLAYSVVFGPGQALGGLKGSHAAAVVEAPADLPAPAPPAPRPPDRARRAARPPRRRLRATAARRPVPLGRRLAADGFDCSGFVRFVYAHFGLALPHSSYADFDLGVRVARGRCGPGISSSSTASATSACTSAAAGSSTRRTRARTSRSRACRPVVPGELRRRQTGRRTPRGPPRSAASSVSERRNPRGTMALPREPAFRAFVMDRPPLHPLVDRLRADERLPAFARAPSRRAPASPRRLCRSCSPRSTRSSAAGSACSLPDDADARDTAEAIGWFARRANRSRCFPRAASSLGSGLEPPPHLVGERARALDVLAARRPRLRLGARASPSSMPPPLGAPGAAAARARRRARHRLGWPRRSSPRATTASTGSRSAASSPSAAGSSTSSRPPAASRCGSSSSATRSRASARSRPSPSALSREVDEATIYPAAERTGGDRRARRCQTTRSPDTVELRDDLVAPLAARPTSSGSPTRCARSGATRASTSMPLDGRARSSTRSRRASRSRSRRSGPRSSPAVSPRPRTSSAGSLRQGLDVIVAFAHRGEAERRRALLRRVEAGDARARRRSRRASSFAVTPGPAGLRLARARRRAPSRHAGLPAPAAAATAAARPGARELLRPAHERLRRPRGPRDLPAARVRDEGGRRRHARLPAARLPGRRPRLRPARADRQGLALHRRRLAARPRSRSSAARPGTTSRTAPASTSARWPASSSQLYAERQTRVGVAYDVEQEWVERLEADFPYRETEDQARAIEAVKEDLEAPRPMDRLVCGDVGFGKTEVALRAAFTVAVGGKQVLMLVPDDDPRPAALEHLPRALPRLPGPRRDGLALPQARRGEAGAGRLRRGQGRRPDRHPPDPLARRRSRRISASSSSTRSSASASPRRSCCASSGSRSTCSRSARRRSRARCTCRSPACATSP